MVALTLHRAHALLCDRPLQLLCYLPTLLVSLCVNFLSLKLRHLGHGVLLREYTNLANKAVRTSHLLAVRCLFSRLGGLDFEGFALPRVQKCFMCLIQVLLEVDFVIWQLNILFWSLLSCLIPVARKTFYDIVLLLVCCRRQKVMQWELHKLFWCLLIQVYFALLDLVCQFVLLFLVKHTTRLNLDHYFLFLHHSTGRLEYLSDVFDRLLIRHLKCGRYFFFGFLHTPRRFIVWAVRTIALIQSPRSLDTLSPVRLVGLLKTQLCRA